MTLSCAVLDDYQNVALTMADWSSLQERMNVNIFNEHMDNEDELAQVLQTYEIIVIMRERTPFRRTLLERLPNLKLLITTGMRNASVDLEAAQQLGVTVCGTAGNGQGPAELTWALILGLNKRLVEENSSLRNNGPWQQYVSGDLYGKRLGLLGLGKIGKQVARVGQAFGMDVFAWSQNLTEALAVEQGVRLAASKEELLAESDIVSVHLVLSERTRGLIGKEELELMRPHAYLINTSRAAIVDQAALKEALANRQIAGAGMDVFEIEPLPASDEFRTLPNVLATPHMGYVTESSYLTFYQQIVEDIQAYLDGEPVRVMNAAR